jgi:hypothetical protein
LALFVIMVIGGAAVYSQPTPRDEHTLCLKSEGSRAGNPSEAADYILIIDKTDKWNNAQSARLHNLIIGMKDQLGINERLSIFVFQSVAQQGFPPVFSLCNPGRGSDTTFWISNPRRWERRFQESFGKPLDDIIAELTTASASQLSPILEVLIDLTNREELSSGVVPRRIVLVSDMLQNSDVYTFFPKPVVVPNTSPTPPSPTDAPMGGPLILVPPNRLLQGKTNTQTGQLRTIPPQKLTPKNIETIVEQKGGLAHLNKFRVEVYQIRGVYPETKLAAARQFWDQIANQYGTKIEWKVL